MLEHRQAMAVHAVRRLFQRHGLAISHGEYWMLCKVIEDGAAPAICNAFRGGTIHCLSYAGHAFYAIWNAEERAISTFLFGMPHEVRLTMRGAA